MNSLRVLCINGTSKVGASTTRSLCDAFAAALMGCGATASDASLRSSLASSQGCAQLRSQVQASELLLLIFPLYLGTVPAVVTQAMDLIADCYLDQGLGSAKHLAVVAHAGLPGSARCHVAIDVCHHFAKACSLDWAGGIAIGMGALIDAHPLHHVRPARYLREGIERAAKDLCETRTISTGARQLAERPMLPAWAYGLWANACFHYELLRYGAWLRRNARPFCTANPRATKQA